MNQRRSVKVAATSVACFLTVVGAATIGASLVMPCDSLRLYLGASDDRVIEDVAVSFSRYPHATVRQIWRGHVARWSMAHIAIGADDPMVVQGRIHLSWRDASGELRQENIDLRSEPVGVTVHAIIAGAALYDRRSYDMWLDNRDSRGFAADWPAWGRTLRCWVRS